MKSFRYLDIVQSAFVSVLIVSNVASSAKIIDWGVSIRGISLAFDAGTLLFPLSYIFGDILTEVYGFRRSRRVIWIGFFAAALSSAYLGIVGWMPGEREWSVYAGQTAYDAILGGMSSGGIMAASLLAYLCGEFCNSVVLAKLKVWTEGRFLWMRTIGSTLVGEGVDVAVFVAIASFFGVFPWSLFWTLVLSNYLFKVSIEVLCTPITYAIVGFLKRAENEDYYDRHTTWNPFGFRVEEFFDSNVI